MPAGLAPDGPDSLASIPLPKGGRSKIEPWCVGRGMEAEECQLVWPRTAQIPLPPFLCQKAGGRRLNPGVLAGEWRQRNASWFGPGRPRFPCLHSFAKRREIED